MMNISGQNPGPFRPGDLPVDTNSQFYHLQIDLARSAPNVFYAGDPERVLRVAINPGKFLSRVEDKWHHRGLQCVTGERDGIPITGITSGMGTGSQEITAIEAVSANEIDTATMTRRPECRRMNFIRVGTSGLLRPERGAGTIVVTNRAVGIDNSGLYLDTPYLDGVERELEAAAREALISCALPNSRNGQKVFPYASTSDADFCRIAERLAAERSLDFVRGITTTAPGFFDSQGRRVTRVQSTFPDLDRALAILPAFDGRYFENMEMESAYLLLLMRALGYRAGAICVGIANRHAESFEFNYEPEVEKALHLALDTLCELHTLGD